MPKLFVAGADAAMRDCSHPVALVVWAPLPCGVPQQPSGDEGCLDRIHLAGGTALDRVARDLGADVGRQLRHLVAASTAVTTLTAPPIPAPIRPAVAASTGET
jgi:hypothetical protein